MAIFLSRAGLSGVLLLTACGPLMMPAQAPPKLIPIPREVSAGPVQSLANGVQINCPNPCAAEDSFAVNDLKTYLATVGVAVNTTSPVSILVARYGTALARSIYADSLAQKNAAAEMPEEMKPEGYSMIPDGKGLALTAA